MPRRILIFSFVYYPHFVGGAEIALKEITDRMPGVEFDLVALRDDRFLPAVERVGNVTVYRFRAPGSLSMNKLMYPFFAATFASRLHARRNYDATWSMMANYSGFAALFFKLFHRKTPFLLTLQEGDPIDYIKARVRVVYPLFRRIFTRANVIQTISAYLSDFAKDMGATCPVIVIPNGVDVKKFEAGTGFASLELRRKIGFSETDKILITTSRLVKKNAVADVIEALLYLGPDVKFLVLGQGQDEEMLKHRAARLGVSERVKFLGYVPHAEMPKYLHASDVFIRPSLSEGFGNSFIEAMAAGLPVIATPVGGIVDFLRDKETGLLCEVNKPEDIARKVEVYLHDVNLRREIVENARAMVSEKYDWDLVARDMREKVFAILTP